MNDRYIHKKAKHAFLPQGWLFHRADSRQTYSQSFIATTQRSNLDNQRRLWYLQKFQGRNFLTEWTQKFLTGSKALSVDLSKRKPYCFSDTTWNVFTSSRWFIILLRILGKAGRRDMALYDRGLPLSSSGDFRSTTTLAISQQNREISRTQHWYRCST